MNAVGTKNNPKGKKNFSEVKWVQINLQLSQQKAREGWGGGVGGDGETGWTWLAEEPHY